MKLSGGVFFLLLIVALFLQYFELWPDLLFPLISITVFTNVSEIETQSHQRGEENGKGKALAVYSVWI